MVVVLVAAAMAGPRTSSLSWVRLDGAEACPTAIALAQAVEAQLGRPVFAPTGDADLAVEGHVARTAAGWRATFRLTDTAGADLGTRTLDSADPSCDPIAQAAAIAVASMIDPWLEPPPAPEPPAPMPAPRWTVGAAASLTAGLGLTPGVGVGGRAAARVTGPVTVEVGGELVPYAPLTDGFLTRATGGALVCPRAGGIEACVGADVGAAVDWHGEERLLAQLHGAVRARVPVVGPLTFVVGAHPIVPLRRPTFGDWRASPVGGFVEIGLAVQNPAAPPPRAGR